MSLAEEDDIFKEGAAALEEDEEEDEELDELEKENEDDVDEENDQDENDQEEENENENENEDGDDAEGDGDGDGDGDEEMVDAGDEDEDVNDGISNLDGGITNERTLDNKAKELEKPLDEYSKLESFNNRLYINASMAESYNINPTTAIPYSSAVHSLALPKNSKWLFTGGEDGYIRKYDLYKSLDGDVQLTAAQKHYLVDSITNGGVLLGYWPNEIPVKRSSVKDQYEPKLSPVFSLAVEKRCLWLLSGLANGGITLQSVRHNEGSIVSYFKKHQDTVSVLRMNQSEDKFLSGSWDKLIHNWDLNTGNIITTFKESTGQISSLEYRPVGGIDIEQQQVANDDDDMDSLFGDEEEEAKTKNSKVHSDNNSDLDSNVHGGNGDNDNDDDNVNGDDYSKSSNANGSSTTPIIDENVFMSSSIDGSINIWDIRSNQQALKLKVPKGTPPWCVSSCWSKDGNFIYTGRRNSTVDEISLKMPYNSSGDTKVSKTLKFPQVSGPVTTVKALPNGEHILCGSYDNIRIYNLRFHGESSKRTPFLIVPGHHGGVLSDVIFDPTYRYMISASGNRGWQGQSTDTVFMYEIELGS